MTMAAVALSNEDLLHQIFHHCCKQDIQSLRQCSRHFDSVASNYLFETLIIGHRKRYLRRLKRVAACEKFRQGVREPVWETASYRCELNMTEAFSVTTISAWSLLTTKGGKYRNSVPAYGSNEVTRARLRALSKDESWALSHGGEDKFCKGFVVDLRAALNSLRGVQRVTFTSWYPGDVLDLSSAEAIATPPPAPALLELGPTRQVQARVFMLLMATLNDLNMKLTSLCVSPTSNMWLQAYIPLNFPGFVLPFDFTTKAPASGLMQPLLELRTLELELGDTNLMRGIDGTSAPSLCQSVTNNGLTRFLSVLTRLRSLNLSLHTTAGGHRFELETTVSVKDVFREIFFPDLHHVHLAGFWEETPEHLCAFLEKHGGRLRTIELFNINIGGTKEAVLDEGGIAFLPSGAERMHMPISEASHQHWQQVAETCSTITSLGGLYIESPSVTENWTYLSALDTEELMEIGMAGKNNELYQGLQLEFE